MRRTEKIDCIYEANIREGNIKNSVGNADVLLDYLRKTDKEIAILGVDTEAQNGFKYLTDNEIRVGCFVSYAREIRRRHYYDYLGFCRNMGFFLLKDYVELSHSNLRAASRNQRSLLTGDLILCEKVAGYLNKFTEYGRNGLC